MQILFSNDITADSRILYHRNITDRVTTIAPFLRYDEDPYLVVTRDGRLVWIRDAYTTTTRYPYSAPSVNGINYIRNSVKVITDAYNGTTDFYVADPRDPLAQTLAHAYPGLLKPLDAMPADLRQHLRYPETIFAIQAAMYSTYHMTNPVVFYNKEDQWEIPAIDIDGNPQLMQPYYTVMRLPGEARAEFIQMLPFTPARKDNLAAWMVARSDPERYGQLEVFEFPEQTIVYGPRQIIARINQDQVISPQITLWNQQGSQVIQGTLLVIPIEEALLYVRPLYLRASGGRIPELNRVIVAYQDQIVMEPTLEAALDRHVRRRDRAPARHQHASARPRPASTLAPRRLRLLTSNAGGAAPASTTSAQCRRSATATGRYTARRFDCSAKRFAGWRNDAAVRSRSGDSVATLAAAHADRRAAAGLPSCRPRRRVSRRSRRSSRFLVRPIAGWKIAATSAAGQKHIGVDGPLAGPLLANRVLQNGADVPLRWQHHESGRSGVRVHVRPAPAEARERLTRRVKCSRPSGRCIRPSKCLIHDTTISPRVGAPQLIADTACACWFVLGSAHARRLAIARSRRSRGDGVPERRTRRDWTRRQRARRSSRRAHMARQRAVHVRRRHRRRPVRHDRHLHHSDPDRSRATACAQISATSGSV